MGVNRNPAWPKYILLSKFFPQKVTVDYIIVHIITSQKYKPDIKLTGIFNYFFMYYFVILYELSCHFNNYLYKYIEYKNLPTSKNNSISKRLSKFINTIANDIHSYYHISHILLIKNLLTIEIHMILDRGHKNH